MHSRLGTLKSIACWLLPLLFFVAGFVVYPRSPRPDDARWQPRILQLSEELRSEGGLRLSAIRKLRPVDGAAVRLPVSLVLEDDAFGYLCDYKNLFAVDLSAGTVTRLSPPPEVKHWNPTGLAIVPRKRQLFVANYHGGNVLVLEVASRNALRFVREIVHPEMKGPENVCVSDDGKSIAVADYDGNAVFVFGADAALRWKADVGAAHGVAFADDAHVIASGLAPPLLVKFDRSGKPLVTQNAQGWDRDRYLWPTSFNVCKNGQIVISDPHTGKISLLDGQLRCQANLGGNGPGFAALHMPYGLALTSREEFLVVDTYKNRLLLVEPATEAIQKVWNLPDDSIGLVEAPTLDRESYIAALSNTQIARHGYTDKRENLATTFTLEFPRFNGRLPDRWHPVYAGLASALPDQPHTVYIPGISPLYLRPHFKFAFGAEVQRAGRCYTIIGSPNCPDVLVVCEGLGAQVRLVRDLWLAGDRLTGSRMTIDLDELARLGAAKIDAYLRLALTSSNILETIRLTLLGQAESPSAIAAGNEDTFRDDFLRSFTSDEGRVFAAVCLATQDMNQLDAAADCYFEAARHKSAVYLVESMFAHAIKAAASRQGIPQIAGKPRDTAATTQD